MLKAVLNIVIDFFLRLVAFSSQSPLVTFSHSANYTILSLMLNLDKTYCI